MQHPDPEQLALAVLPAEPVDRAVQAHLQQCASCRSEIAALQRTVDLARTDVGDVGAPPSRVWDAITDELAADDARPEEVHPPARGRAVEHATPRPWWRAALAPAAAAVIGLGTGLGIAALWADSLADVPGEVARAPLSPVSATAPGASGSVSVASTGSGREISVQVDGVGAGEGYLEAWLMDDAGTKLVSLGPLVADGPGFTGTFRLPAGLPADEFGVVDVSAEQWDGDPAHSQVSVVRGPLA